MTSHVSQSWHISRRTMIRGCGAALAMPLLDVMNESVAAATAKPPVRMGYLYFPNGVADGSWQPKQVDASGKLVALNDWMSPLEPFKEDIIIPENMWTPHGNGHIAGTATWLTGGGYDGRRIHAGGASADQLAANAIGKETLLPSLELSVRGEGFFSNSLPRNSVSWRDANTPMPRDTEPRIVFDRMFRTGRQSLSQKSVLDSVLEDARSLKNRVSDNDRRKVEEYLESVRAIERRIDFSQAQRQRAASNRLLQRAMVRPELDIPDDHQEYMRQMLDMIVLAFWSDATRVTTFMLDHGQSNRYFDFVDDVKGTWHALSHWKDISGRTEDDDGKTSWSSRDEKRDMYNRVTRWHHEQVAYLLNRLKQIDESGKTLLDNSMLLYGSSLSDGHEHAAENLPLLLAGGGGSTIRTGRHVKYRRQESVSKLHLSILQRSGVTIEEFGGAREPMNELG